ncbi:hypothetical protein ESA94_19330 [Lacibacter luteus]|uniref:Uncharacterized protein n=1 Tax=Lacibacter luteus TaxID=2508719 RepID=A0A4Q1CEQ5_9BACT|nr:hypothetical protein [Lacibacter luteus]RXK58164.1 hypothetical protein ESA94_19330 [Lacibacter luteus]
MKKFICILFLGAYLVSSTELRQLLKFPLLLQHYAEHRQQDHSLSLVAFFALHYNDEDIIDLDYSKDQQLPFKSQGGYSGAALSIGVPASFYISVPKPVHSAAIERYIPNDDFISAVFLSSIWQPPRSC